MSTAISDGMLSALRTVYNTRLRRTCTLKQPGAPSASRGQITQSESDAATNVKCSFMAAAGNERVVGGALAKVGNYILTFETGVTVKPEMRAVVAASGSEPERSFSLVAPLDEPQMIGQRWLATEP